jgi:hypothetical protein
MWRFELKDRAIIGVDLARKPENPNRLVNVK